MRRLRKANEDAHTLLLYYVTSPSGNFIGLYALPDAYVLDDLQWKAKRLTKARQALIDEGAIAYDVDAGVVYVPQVLQWAPISTPEHAKGAIRKLQALPSTFLRERFRHDLLQWGLCSPDEKVRPLLEFLGLTPVAPPSDNRLTGTPSHSPSPSSTQAHLPSPFANTNGDATGGPLSFLNARGTDGPTIPRTRAEVAFEERIAPLTREPHRRDEWLRALRNPKALDALEDACRDLEAANSRGQVRNPGAFLWAKFRDLCAARSVEIS